MVPAPAELEFEFLRPRSGQGHLGGTGTAGPGALCRFVPPCIPVYSRVFPCISLYLFCTSLYFLVFVLYALYCLVLPCVALGAQWPTPWEVIPLVSFVFLCLLP